MSALNVFAVLPKPTNHSELHECIAAFSTSSTIKGLTYLIIGLYLHFADYIIYIQGISEKCTGAFKFWCRIVF